MILSEIADDIDRVNRILSALQYLDRITFAYILHIPFSSREEALCRTHPNESFIGSAPSG